MNNIKKNFGKRVKYFREQNNLTQEQLAEKLEMNCRSLSFIECGTNFVSADTLENLCKILKVNPKQLFDFDYSMLTPIDIEKAIYDLINTNKDKLNEIYKIIYLYLNVI